MTRKFYRDMHEDDGGAGRNMEASVREMQREEARSRRIGRAEDAAAAREEELERQAEAARCKRRKQTGSRSCSPSHSARPGRRVDESSDGGDV